MKRCIGRLSIGRPWIGQAWIGLGAAVLAVSLTAAEAADPLPSLAADLDGTSVSGLSSGAYMAGQFHVAYSALVDGAGIVAGGPYDCAEGVLTFALQRCMETSLGVPDPAASLARAKARAARGEIDPLSGLAGDRVYVFSGTRDATVTPPVVATVPAFYRLAGVPAAAIETVDTLPAGHAFVAEGAPNACGVTGAPYVNDCDGYDQAGAILARIVGPLAPPSATPTGRLVAFDQAAFLADPTAHGLATTGYVYVPDACAGGGCRVHVVFHGCRQTAEMVGDAVTQGAGFNRWADTNRLIVLYPQTSETLANPRACWDWWGYDDPRYATKAGRQMVAARAMLDRLAATAPTPEPAPFCARFAGSNFAHWLAGRARSCDFWFVCAVGSGERLGLLAGASTLFEHPQGSFGTAACSA